MNGMSVIICGAGGHGKVVADVLERGQRYRVLGFLDDRNELAGRQIGGHGVLGSIQGFLQNGIRQSPLILAVGSNETRQRLAMEMKAAGTQFVTAIHPSAQIGRDVVIGPGTVIMANAVVNPGARIGAHVIINTAATVDHDCVVEDFAHIAPGAHLAGTVSVGQGALLGTGVSAVPAVRIGCWTVVGAGATVVRDLPDRVTAVGTPAVPIHSKGR